MNKRRQQCQQQQQQQHVRQQQWPGSYRLQLVSIPLTNYGQRA